MAAFVISRTRVTNPELMKEYSSRSAPLAQKYGGTYVVRSNSVEALEGDYDGRRLIIMRFPDVKTVKEFWNSPEYKELRPLRLAASESEVWLVSDE